MKTMTIRKIIIAVAILIFLGGLGIVLYPHVNAVVSAHKEARLIENFDNAYHPPGAGHTVSLPPASASHQDLYEALKNYNEELYEDNQVQMSTAAFAGFPVSLGDYGFDSEMIGYITIPAMDLQLPLNLGASSKNMANGAAVCGGTSAPIGGASTNCVIAGHRGYRGTPKFRYIEKLVRGDKVYITNLWETLTYQVKDIEIVDPDDISGIKIVQGEDRVTLLTCHPYASGGKYRYLVICERVDG